MPSESPSLHFTLPRVHAHTTTTAANHPLRRLIGRRFDDATVKKDIESWPFTIVDDDGQPKIQVEYLGEKKTFSAQEISSMVLLKVCHSHRTLLYITPHILITRTTTDEGDCRDQAWQEG